MAIRATCPNGHRLSVKPHWAGRSGRCPTCHALMKVPHRNPISDAEALDWIGDYMPPEYMRPTPKTTTLASPEREPSVAGYP